MSLLGVEEAGDGPAMEGWVLIAFDPVTRKEVWSATIDGVRKIRTVMPVDDILDANAEAQVDALNRPFGDVAPVARVPMHVWQRHLAPAMQQGDDAHVKRWLNNSDHSKFRLRAGRL